MLPAQQQLPIPYIVPPHLEEYNIPLSAFAAARPQFHNIVGGAFIFSTTVPDAVTSITTSASAPTTTKRAAQGTTAPTSPLASTPPPVPVSASSSPSPSPSSSPSSPTPTAAAQSPQTPTSSSSTTSTPATTPGTTPDDHLYSLSPDDDLHGVHEPEPKTLLLQRSITDSYPCHWENPGGLIDPVRDATVLAGVAREVREETGLHVSRFVDLVCVDEWTKMKRGVLLQETKVTFLVEVREAAAAGWEERVKLAEGEHQAFVWVGEGEVRGVVRDKGKKRKASGRLGVGFINEQGGNVLRGFEVVRGLRGC
ncbi:hypothetical protein BO86DRAFT_456646 [Aspergillus japonicus CBS 114.51]|uniref:Nudix hydrolase domain-containing protein n=1 Tax=Aspergillus japonicus CBS 114.51 TaxID=1448312 RepID=A0A8T8WZC9_ASPJA|nr:hypothetical protein BO86DRAFT_456646 [Aspergillus japonicus CBS 114.51]RAH81208.1 hypothetical protein BO86DRAFT_456646 [Aspergillus japonicus CBS 114.51]